MAAPPAVMAEESRPAGAAPGAGGGAAAAPPTPGTGAAAPPGRAGPAVPPWRAGCVEANSESASVPTSPPVTSGPFPRTCRAVVRACSLVIGTVPLTRCHVAAVVARSDSMRASCVRVDCWPCRRRVWASAGPSSVTNCLAFSADARAVSACARAASGSIICPRLLASATIACASASMPASCPVGLPVGPPPIVEVGTSRDPTKVCSLPCASVE